MAPSLNLFSRRKNSDEMSPSAVKSSLDGVASSKLVKQSRSKEPSPTSPTPTSGLTYVPKIRTRAVTYGPEDSSITGYAHVRSNSNSDTWKLQNRGGPQDFRHGGLANQSGTNSPLPPLPPSPEPLQKIYQPAPIRTQRFRHQPQLSISSESEDITPFPISGSHHSEPPTPVNSAVTPTSAPLISAFDTAKRREFRFPLPISPPLSPESPTIGHSPMETAWTDEHERRQVQPLKTGMSPLFPPLSNSSMSANNDYMHSPTTALLQRVQELENRNRELLSEAALHSSRINALRQSQSSVIDTLKEAHAVELEALRNSSWPTVIKGKEKELELLRSNNDGFKIRIQILEQRLKERDEELDWIKEKMRALESERAMEETEVAALDLLDIGRRLLDEIRRRKAAEQSADDLVAMVTKINTRLAEEKRKNKHHDGRLNQITEDAWSKVSESKHDIQKLKNALEDKDTMLRTLHSDISTTKRERSEFEEAWKREQNENAVLRQSIVDREERIRDLEFESSELRGGLELSHAEVEQLRKQSEVHEDILVKLVEGSSSSRCSSAQPGGHSSGDEIREDPQKTVENLRRDVKLYRSDIRAYRRDVKSRDKTITKLQSQLSSPVSPNDALLQDFPQTPTSKMKEEIDLLRLEVENRIAMTKQQALVLIDMEEKMKVLRREKELLEMKHCQGMKLKLEQQKSGGNSGNGEEFRVRRVPSGRRKKEILDLDIPKSPPPASPLPLPPPPPPPPRKNPARQTPGEDDDGPTFVW